MDGILLFGHPSGTWADQVIQHEKRQCCRTEKIFYYIAQRVEENSLHR
jgi:hypothetical protein